MDEFWCKNRKNRVAPAGAGSIRNVRHTDQLRYAGLSAGTGDCPAEGEYSAGRPCGERAVVRFRSEGVEKLADVLGDDLDGLSARLNATVEVSRDYRSFSGLTDGMDGTVRFVYRTEAVEKAE